MEKMFKSNITEDIIKIIELFVEMVEVRAEKDILVTCVTEGAHYRAMHSVLDELKTRSSESEEKFCTCNPCFSEVHQGTDGKIYHTCAYCNLKINDRPKEDSV